MVCSQCENAFCMQVCPVGAITRTSQGVVQIDPDQCIGCALCVQYCPVDMVQIDPDTKRAVKCELCRGNPACVAACPTGALVLAESREKEQTPHD